MVVRATKSKVGKAIDAARRIATIKPEGSRFEYRLFLVPTKQRDAIIYELRAFSARSTRGILAMAVCVGIDEPLRAHRYARERVKLFALTAAMDPRRACEAYRALEERYCPTRQPDASVARKI